MARVSGASINTRASFTTKATFSASGPIAEPAATTWASVCSVSASSGEVISANAL